MVLNKILVANRGEIACRIIRAAKKLGKTTVGVYSTADADALHVRNADYAVEIGPPSAIDSYLRMDKLVAAAKINECQGIHPGYGFLSENADFVDLLSKEHIHFIGPSAPALRAMGDKIESKLIAKSAGVNTIPGFVGVVENPDHAVQVAGEIGYPVMVKASAGGGGKGMRIAHTPDETVSAFRLCSQEAQSSFGDNRLLIEKFVLEPRHVEIQIVGDSEGNVVYLPERECSIQRRNQKIFEEAPSTLLDEDVRRRMGEQAVALANAVGYQSVGTVEFLVSAVDKSFYFLEMNTRLQVEHPITEAITGLDLACLMLQVADGEPLPFKQRDITAHGWAMESRVYAENAAKDFSPSSGTLRAYLEPQLPQLNKGPDYLADLGFDAAGVRVDSGVDEGAKVQVFYDPLISKLIVHGNSREQARMAMAQALDSYVITGVENNLPFLRALMTEPEFVDGRTTTDFIPKVWPNGFDGVRIDDTIRRNACAVAAALYRRSAAPEEALVASVDDASFSLRVVGDEVLIDKGADSRCEHEWRGFRRVDIVEENICGGGMAALLKVDIDGQRQVFQRLGRDTTHLGSVRLGYHGAVLDVRVRPKRVADLEHICPEREAEDESHVVRSPIPGSVKSVAVKAGESVVEDQELLVLEAMKMQNILRARKSGKVKVVLCSAGDVVAADSALVEYEQ